MIESIKHLRNIHIYDTDLMKTICYHNVFNIDIKVFYMLK